MLRAAQLLAATTASIALICGATPHADAEPRPCSDEWWFQTWGIDKIWPVTKGSGVTVAVLDSGVEADLPDLAGAVVPGANMDGSNGDGRTDSDPEGHGTAMAALIAAQGTSPTGFLGVAPEAKILPVRVGYQASSNGTFDEQVSRAIRFAVDHGAKVISMSIGQEADPLPDHCSPKLQQAIAYAAEHDVIAVAAAGNDGGLGFNPHDQPAGCAGVVAVGAIDSAARPWAKTERADYLTVAGPGVGVGWVGTDGKYYPNGAGTSQAAALTAAGLALVRAARPDLSARTVVQRMIATANPTSTRRWHDQTGYGAFRIHRVMDTVGYPVAANAPNPVYQRLDQWSAQHRTAVPSATPYRPPSPKTHHGLSAIALSLTAVIPLAGVMAAAVIIARRRWPPPAARRLGKR